MKTIKDYNFQGKRALIRVDFNVPQNEKLEVTDNTRIQAAKPSIDKILNDGGSVVILTHLGRPKGQVDEQFSLKHILLEVSKVLGREVKFCPVIVGEEAEKMTAELKAGEVLLMENVRFYEGEEKGDKNFAESLSKLGDAYVNDAFGTAHREHASTAVIADFFPSTKFFGLLMEKELEAIDKVLGSGERPVTAILGGSKVSTKITIIENILPAVDNLIIGGGMAFTFIKAQGGQIGNSLVEEDKMSLALEILQKAEQQNVKVYLPVDVTAADSFSNEAETQEVDSNEIPEGWMGLDVGARTRALNNDVIMNSRTILWNGPLGVFEMSNFSAGTEALGDSIAEATKQGAFSLVGGGDSVAFVKQFNYSDKVSYVSTGGGAMLESLEGLELPGVAAINK
ncbi:phosphoglycerate kinase [Riemerella anatipestifer]|uniref:Phosphoglycerate kinase n=1 Tax=Riemerella anatipestifer (strain ATCC 11845 / DSM 15868 / JCM 9532 / NCTC 11014) TaxID=693978 RepID=E4TA90_RIEAD|nr:phosphoglycerate kinase [Riemerella anatipestifer]ADQ82250.1 Phosphoglycerate kinase [Riemerella anatipestifer ATCC 11845 = DSM 15868]ADZ12247.1 3-phosphoglycerate kinase [Riemerella anatipestifer RA-GD]AFD56253.1 phosphoglycerate kinase [Riemerella anatipestifer ATCC 11845 = DSM 15868]AGC39826.1 3-phosphoglycerate kinase [Riemerella anatipestifer RA-CH-2]AKP69456.1 phosphoglycerate kinase [Riemerella anatipestifer]